MRISFTFLTLFLFSKILPAQEINLTSQVDSFILCTSVTTETGESIGQVNSQLSGYTGAPGIPFPNPFYLGACGTIYPQYVNGFITLYPLKDIDYLNGVSTYDMVLISKHILGTQPLGSPYKIIAADINNSGSISALDLIELRKLVLAINTTFPTNTSWRFLDADFVFPDPNNPWATSFPEICQITNFDEDISKNFIGIKIGDVNGSAINDTLLVVEDRTVNDKLVFQFENQKFEAREELLLAFKAQDFKTILGFQFELSFDHEVLKFKGFEKGKLNYFDENNFGLNDLQNGIIASNWINLNGEQFEDSNEVLFYLKFESLTSGNLKDLIKITENRLKAEAYKINDDVLDLTFNFSEPTIASTTKLFQNQPNPFDENTFISFYIETDQSVKLKIFNVQGNLVRAYKNSFEAGYNQFMIKAQDVSMEGLYYYHLETEDETFTKKMIKL